ncbi:MAG: hypothetical protein ACI8PZ_006670 [Myxococcota bacterium]|jgi:hypothetical protein
MSDDLTDVTQHRFPLAEAIQTLRRELRVAMQDRDPTLPLTVKEAQVSLNVAFARKTGAGAKLQAWVVGVEASAAGETETTHTLQLTLVPRTADGGTVEVSSDTLPHGVFDR